jgi:hypothetical protein
MMNVLFVHQQSPRAPVMITCERCHTCWPVSQIDDAPDPAAELGLMLVKALAHPCSGSQSDHERRVGVGQVEGPGLAPAANSGPG